MSELWLWTWKIHKQIGCQAAILDHITTKMDMHMYVIEHCPNTNFEWDLFKHVWVMALDMKIHKQNGCQAAILDRIMTTMNMHIYAIEHCPNTNSEWDLCEHVWVMALDRENSQTKWLLGGHIGSYHKTNWRAYVCHSMLPLYQVWKKSVQASPRNSCGQTEPNP